MAQDNNGKMVLNLVVGIATAGRREILSEVIDYLMQQTRLPDTLIICPTEDADVDHAVINKFPGKTLIVKGPRGLCSQRNATLSHTNTADVIVFFDDDFLPHPTYLQETEKLFLQRRDVVMATGKVLADGILGPGLEVAKGHSILKEVPNNPANSQDVVDVYNGYGCNMAFRLSEVHQYKLRFDEALPLYSWLEDVDFSRRLAPFGKIVKSSMLLGVHLGTKRGRTSGVKFGYSQIANPLYMAMKGTLSWWRAFRQIGRNILANLSKVFRSEPWVDRKGRVKGNAIALCDLCMGRLKPQRILDF